MAKRGLEYFNNLLADKPFVAGEEFSMADITLFTGLAFADFVNVDIPETYEHLHQWRERVAQRPGVKAALAG